MSECPGQAAVRGQLDRREIEACCLLYCRSDAPHAKQSRAAYGGTCFSVRSEPRIRACLDLRTRSQDEGTLMPDEMYGRTELEWEALEAVGWDFLITRAKRPGDPRTNYTEVNEIMAERTGQPMWNFNFEHDRAAMGKLLGRLVDRSYIETKNQPSGGLMISAIVMFLNENGVGGGFYRKAASLRLIASERMSADAKFDFWVKQMTAVVAWAKTI
jgi:hypothetical protein